MSNIWILNSGKSGKVWGYTSFINDDGSWRIVYWWGSIGRRMDQLQQMQKNYPTHSHAQWEVETKVEDKEGKGYRRMPNGAYFDLVYDFQNKVDEYIEELAVV